jgi:hypothetical protein
MGTVLFVYKKHRLQGQNGRNYAKIQIFKYHNNVTGINILILFSSIYEDFHLQLDEMETFFQNFLENNI